MSTQAASTGMIQDRGRAFGPLLSVRDLRVTFPSRRAEAVERRRAPADERFAAVDSASLTVYPGQTVAVVGESGCGKSVTALSILRLLPAPPARVEAGSILLAGPEAGAPPRDLLTIDDRSLRSVRGGEIAMIFQEPMTSLNPVLTIGEQIAEAVLLHQRVSADEAWARAGRALEEVGIGESRRRLGQYPHEFSGGMRQRVMIAMALACRPRLLIADEPTTALDVTVQAQILTLLRGLKSRGLAMLLITHALGIVAENADVVCVMYAGRVVEYASVEAVFDRPLHPYTRALLACTPQPGRRVERLRTVGETIGAASVPIETTGRGFVTPWWPGHAAPSGASGSTLIEASPGHWLGVWSTPEVAAGPPAPPPDLPCVRSAANAGVGGVACAS